MAIAVAVVRAVAVMTLGAPAVGTATAVATSAAAVLAAGWRRCEDGQGDARDDRGDDRLR